MTEIIYKKESHAIIGACFEVYNEKGSGFLNAWASNLSTSGFRQSLNHRYRGRILMQTYEPDYVCFEKIIVELKAVSTLTDEHRAQLRNYLHATGCELGLLVNFGHYPKLEYERIARTQHIKAKTDLSDVSL